MDKHVAFKASKVWCSSERGGLVHLSFDRGITRIVTANTHPKPQKNRVRRKYMKRCSKSVSCSIRTSVSSQNKWGYHPRCIVLKMGWSFEQMHEPPCSTLWNMRKILKCYCMKRSSTDDTTDLLGCSTQVSYVPLYG